VFGPFIEQHDACVFVLMHDVVVRSGGFVFACDVRVIYLEQGSIGLLLGGG